MLQARAKLFLKESVLTHLQSRHVSGAIHWMTKKQCRLGSSSGQMAVTESSRVPGQCLLVQWSMQELVSNILLGSRQNLVHPRGEMLALLKAR